MNEQLRWTTDFPAADGLYWMRAPYMSEPEVVRLYLREGARGSVFFIGNEIDDGVSADGVTQWAGPLLPPGENPDA